MTSQDWEKFGETIKNTVQDAIDSQDFEKLNQTITNTINDAVDGFAQGMKNAGRSRTEYKDQGGRTGRRREYTGHNYKQQPYSGGYYQANRQEAYSYGCDQANRWQKNEHQVDQKRSQQQYPAVLYRKTNGVRIWGGILMGTGGVCGILFLLAFAAWIVGSVFGIGNISHGAAIGLTVTGGLSAVNGWLAYYGSSRMNRAERFQRYVAEIGYREYCNVKELAEKTGKKAKYIVKDLEYMIRKKWFLQGHLDEGKTCLMVTDRMYQQYIGLKNEREQNEQEEAARKARSLAQDAQNPNQEGQAQNPQEKNPQDQKREQAEREKLAPEVRKIVEAGDAYIRKIHECNDAIPGEEISAKISRMELLVDGIFDRVEQNPESVGDIRRLMDYYLPTTVKLLEAYQELDSQPVDTENIRSSKAEIEATLDTLNTAFEKLLDDLFRDTAWDVSSDISVLQTMLAQEGLTEEGWKK
ncbi:5-bromo-4-chloroindolyl phosphate hydrolysis family protein [Bariatricus sp. SGI.154]|uniref:5-bromo-4-chloroindolyl phosphate hydrolysis family protein n=1 Tax=Bariatricus sp. SGI.154 TaxID=3420549 RepID=UPI003D032EFF